MNHHRLSMRKAHGEMGTFLFSFGEMTKVININQKTDVLLKFRHTQYAPVGERNALKNNEFLAISKSSLWPSVTTESLKNLMVTAFFWPTNRPTGEKP